MGWEERGETGGVENKVGKGIWEQGSKCFRFSCIPKRVTHVIRFGSKDTTQRFNIPLILTFSTQSINQSNDGRLV